MSRHGDIALVWGDQGGPGENGEYTFRLGIAEWRKLDERFGVGPYELYHRLRSGTWKIDYPREVIRLALQAGGSCMNEKNVDDRRINRLVRDYVDDRPPMVGAETAVIILGAILVGPADDQPPKSAAAEEAIQSFPTEDSPSPPSTDGDLSSATRRRKSTRSRSGNSTHVSPAT